MNFEDKTKETRIDLFDLGWTHALLCGREQVSCYPQWRS